MEHSAFQLEIECSASEIPDKLVASLKQLEVGESIHAKQIELPPGVRLMSPEDTLVVSCHAAGPEGEGEEEPAAAETGEPEIIGKKPEEEEES